MDIDVVSLRHSLDRVVARDPTMKNDFYEAFYRNLFDRHPTTRALFFRAPLAMQEKMLADSVVSIIEYVDGSPWLAHKLAAMGRKHVEYRVKPEMYAWVGDALRVTLAEIEGDLWSESLQRAWSEAYDAVVAMMLAGLDATTVGAVSAQ